MPVKCLVFIPQLPITYRVTGVDVSLVWLCVSSLSSNPHVDRGSQARFA